MCWCAIYVSSLWVCRCADLFKALVAAGVSRRRSAVPPSQRGVQAWFAQRGPAVDSLLLQGGPGVAAEQVQVAQGVWEKADDYYFRSMARLQRLWQVSKLAMQCIHIAR